MPQAEFYGSCVFVCVQSKRWLTKYDHAIQSLSPLNNRIQIQKGFVSSPYTAYVYSSWDPPVPRTKAGTCKEGLDCLKCWLNVLLLLVTATHCSEL